MEDLVRAETNPVFSRGCAGSFAMSSCCRFDQQSNSPCLADIGFEQFQRIALAAVAAVSRDWDQARNRRVSGLVAQASLDRTLESGASGRPTQRADANIVLTWRCAPRDEHDSAIWQVPRCGRAWPVNRRPYPPGARVRVALEVPRTGTAAGIPCQPFRPRQSRAWTGHSAPDPYPPAPGSPESETALTWPRVSLIPQQLANALLRANQTGRLYSRRAVDPVEAAVPAACDSSSAHNRYRRTNPRFAFSLVLLASCCQCPARSNCTCPSDFPGTQKRHGTRRPDS